MAGNSNSGRRPQPTALRVLRGNPGKRRLPTNEPTPPAATAAFDTPPPELDDDPIASAEWRRVAPMLRTCKLVTEAERTVLIALCQQWSRYCEAQQKIRELGMVMKTPKGIPIVNPYLGPADKALQHCQRLWTELGLTPSGRAKITAIPTGDRDVDSKWDGLLSGVTDTRKA